MSEKPVRDRPRRLADWLNPAGDKKVHSLVDKVYKRWNLEAYLISAPLPFPPGVRRVAVEPDVQRRGSDGVHQGVRPRVRPPLRPGGVAATPRGSRATPPGERTPPTRTRRGSRQPRSGATPVQ